MVLTELRAECRSAFMSGHDQVTDRRHRESQENILPRDLPCVSTDVLYFHFDHSKPPTRTGIHPRNVRLTNYKSAYSSYKHGSHATLAPRSNYFEELQNVEKDHVIVVSQYSYNLDLSRSLHPERRRVKGPAHSPHACLSTKSAQCSGHTKTNTANDIPFRWPTKDLLSLRR